MHPDPLNVLISPLDWGLGHASRCIPIIKQLVQIGHKVTIAGSGRSLVLLQKEFPHLESIELKGFSPSYSRSGNMVLHLVLLVPQFIGAIIREHRYLKKLISHYHFDIIISDNRYGLWNKRIRSIFITHQVMIKTPAWLKLAEYGLYRISRFMISRFDECWIPDYKEVPWLSGDLAHKFQLPPNAKFIGPLSRFQLPEKTFKNKSGKGMITAIISGPEPQRSIFEDLLTKQLSGINKPVTIIRGMPDEEKDSATDNNLTILPHLAMDQLKDVILSSSLVICRSGYSSIMDLHSLGVKALFVPTPGQTEQIYLADLHQKSGTAFWKLQENLNLDVDIENALQYAGFININTNISALAEAIVDLKKK